MGIQGHINGVVHAFRNDDLISKHRLDYVNKFYQLLESTAKTLGIKDSNLPVIRKMYEFGIQLLEERILITCVRSQSEDIESSTLEKYIRKTELNFMAKFKEELKNDEPPQCDDLLSFQNTLKGLHNINPVLSRHSSELLKTLNPVGTTVLDDLAQHDIITDSDEEFISHGHSRQDQNRHLLAVLSTSSPDKDMSCFVNYLRENHESLGEKFAETVREYASEQLGQTCAACTVITMVDPCRIAKGMFEKGNIPTNFYNDLMSFHLSTEEKWKLIRQKRLEEEAILALRPKYDHFFFMFNDQLDLTCTCEDSDSDFSVPRISTPNSRRSSFKRWSSRNLGNDEMDTVFAELRHLRSSVDDMNQTLERLPRAASLPDTRLPSRHGSSRTDPGRVAYRESYQRDVSEDVDDMWLMNQYLTSSERTQPDSDWPSREGSSRTDPGPVASRKSYQRDVSEGADGMRQENDEQFSRRLTPSLPDNERPSRRGSSGTTPCPGAYSESYQRDGSEGTDDMRQNDDEQFSRKPTPARTFTGWPYPHRTTGTNLRPFAYNESFDVFEADTKPKEKTSLLKRVRKIFKKKR